MSEMIERVAKALCAEGGYAEWEIQLEKRREDFRSSARAAIEAMREPTEAMLDAVSFHAPKYEAERCTDGSWMIVDVHRSCPVKEGMTSPDEAHDLAETFGAKDAINAMIDEALK